MLFKGARGCSMEEANLQGQCGGGEARLQTTDVGVRTWERCQAKSRVVGPKNGRNQSVHLLSTCCMPSWLQAGLELWPRVSKLPSTWPPLQTQTLRAGQGRAPRQGG